MAAAALIGVVINFVHLDPIKALFWSALPAAPLGHGMAVPRPMAVAVAAMFVTW
jgi:hypothetical protein